MNTLLFGILIVLCTTRCVSGFSVRVQTSFCCKSSSKKNWHASSVFELASSSDNDGGSNPILEQEEDDEEAVLFGQRQVLKLSLLFQAQDTQRGFTASSSQRTEISDLISQLAQINPTKEPAAAYYDNKYGNSGDQEPNIAGKWTLAYTDAPDITSLDVSTSSLANSILPSPPPAAQLGRIGQECNASKSTITNVIEWKRPGWVGDVLSRVNLESGNSDETKGRVLQKVVCEAKATPDKPNIVDLQLVGFDLVGETTTSAADSNGLPSISSLLNEGPAAIFSNAPVKLRGPLKAPFGKFEILYLDEDMRIIKTNQGYYAVNIREPKPWF